MPATIPQICIYYIFSGPVKEQLYTSMVPEKKPSQQDIPVTSQAQSDPGGTQNNQHNYDQVLTCSRKPKVKKKGSEVTLSSTGPEAKELQDAVVGGFCEMLGDLCSRAKILDDDHDESKWLSLPIADMRMLVNEIMSIREKNFLHFVPVDILLRMLRVLDHQIHRAEDMSASDRTKPAVPQGDFCHWCCSRSLLSHDDCYFLLGSSRFRLLLRQVCCKINQGESGTNLCYSVPELVLR